MQFEIQLALPDGHFRAGVLCKLLMRLVEEVIRLFDAHLGDAFEVLVAVQVLHHVARGAATAITETEEQKRAVGEILVLEVLLGVVKFLNLAPSSISIRRREVGEDARAVDASHMNEWCGNLVVSFHEIFCVRNHSYPARRAICGHAPV